MPPQQRPATPPPAADDLLSGRHKAAKFDAYGQVIGGPIVEPPRTEQQTDPTTRAPKFYPKSGDPMWHILVSVQAQQPAEEDDGVRTFYVKGGMRDAVSKAIAQSGAQRLEVGGNLQIRYLREEPNSFGSGNPKKVYEARYTPPTGTAPAAPPTPAAPAAGPDPTVMANLPSDQQPRMQASFDSGPPF